MILPHHGSWPVIHETAFVAPSADVIGEVSVGQHSSIWFQCVLRGDVHWIKIGRNTNIQDHSLLHVTRGMSPLSIGDDVTVGHRVTLHGCRVGNRVLVGMGAIILDDAEISDDSIVGAGALVTKGKKFPPRSLIIGVPAKVLRVLTDQELVQIRESAEHYVKDAAEYRAFLRGPARLGESNADLEEIDEGNWNEDLG